MSNNKQSSIECFLDKLIEHQIIKVGQTTYGGKVNYKHEILFEQAKEMHKEEMINFAIKCMYNSDDIGSNLKNYFIKKYDERFGGNK